MTNSSRVSKKYSDLASWLQSVGDDKLGQILRNREDSVHPIPPGTTSLAVRLQLPGSIRPAFAHLSVFDFAVLEKAIALGGKANPLSAPEIVESLGTQPELDELVAESIEKLSDFALIFGDAESFMLVDGVAAQFDHVPIRLPDPDALSAQQVTDLLGSIDERQKKILDTVMLSGGTGISKDAAPDADPTRPIPQLIASGLLTRVSESTVAIPRGVRAVLSGATAPTSFMPPKVAQPPAEKTPEVSGTALETVRGVRDLVEYVGRHPIALLRDGAVGVRNLGSTTKDLRKEKEELYPLFTLALQTGLLGTGVPRPRPDEDELKNYLAPTGMLDEFVELSLAQQWAYVAASWFEYSTTKPWAIGLPGRMEAGKPKAVRLLDKEMKDPSLPLMRRVLLEIAARGPLTRKELVAVAAYERPLVIAHRSAEDIDGIVDEAVSLGILAETTHLFPTDVLHALLSAETPATETPVTAITDEGKALQTFAAYQRVAATTAALTPQEVDQFIMQADMTVLVPGPMPRPMQVELALLADLESAGMASVYRITEESLARGFEAGRSDEEIMGFFTRHNMGEVPQTLTYLVSDLARRHGTVRAGTALSYVTSKDPDALAPVAASLGLRLLAPTVAISQQPLPEVLAALKEAGLNPAAENEDGISIDIRPEPARVRYTATTRRQPLSEDRVQVAIAKIRELDGTTKRFTENFQTVIHRAIKAQNDLVITTNDGEEITVSPIDVRMGRLSAVNADNADMVSVLLKEITEIEWKG